MVEFLQLLSELENMCDGRLGRNMTARHRIELAYNDRNPVHSVPYCASPTTRQLATNKVQKDYKKGSLSQLTQNGPALLSLRLKHIAC